MSFKQVSDKHGASLLKAVVLQGTLETRNHGKLDPTHASTAELDPQERLQYRDVREVKLNDTSDVNELKKDKEDTDVPGPETDEREKKVVALVRKAHNAYLPSGLETKLNLGKYEQNEYSGFYAK